MEYTQYWEKLEANFWSKYKEDTKTGCWIWEDFLNPKGYGRIKYKLQNGAWVKRSATRMSWGFTHKVSLLSDALVCHICDNPPCINPKHLFIGTAQDNTLDCVAKGRHISQTHPELIPKRYSDSLILEIIRQHKLYKRKYTDIAKEFKVSETHVQRIVKGQSRKNIQSKV